MLPELTDSKNNIALLLFSRTVKEEAETKGFSSKSKRVNYAISNKLYQHTRAICRHTGLALFSSPNVQKGDSFAEKLVNEIDSIFQLGYEKIIVVGSDSPNLNVSHLLHTKELLNAGNRLVLGPSLDGGVYLIGLDAQNCNSVAFLDLPWQSPDLLEELKKFDEKTYLLEWLADIDSEKDLHHYLNNTVNKDIVRVLKNLILSSTPKTFIELTINRQLIYTHTLFRGPPLTITLQ